MACKIRKKAFYGLMPNAKRPYSRSALYCGVNVPAETGKMSHSDKRGATLPKVAAVALLLRNDMLNKRHRERSVAIPKIGVRANILALAFSLQRRWRRSRRMSSRKCGIFRTLYAEYKLYSVILWQGGSGRVRLNRPRLKRAINRLWIVFPSTC